MFTINNSKIYDAVKWIALVLLPALGVLYVALGAIWNFSNTQAVEGTILAVDTFLGALVHLSSTAYKASDAAHDGTMHVLTNSDGTQTATMELNSDPADIVSKDSVSFKVKPVTADIPAQTPEPGKNGF